MSLRTPRRLLGLFALIGLVGALVLASPNANNAGAQPTVAPNLSLDVEMSEDGSSATVLVVVDPGSEIVAALDGVVSYNPDHATPTGCEDRDGFGACNPESPGMIRFARAKAEAWSDSTVIVAITFDVTDASDIGLSVGAVYSPANEEIETVTVGDPVTLGTIAAATGSGSMTGTILAGDSAQFGTQVCVESQQTDLSVCADADNRGSYRIDGLATGSYTVTARHYSGDYAPLTIADVAVVSPNLTQGVDGTLVSADAADATEGDADASADASDAASVFSADSGVSGTVTNSNGDPVPAALVCAEDPAIGNASCSGTGFDGTYEIADLAGGNYVVTVTDPGGRYADQSGERFGLNGDEHRTIDFTLSAG